MNAKDYGDHRWVIVYGEYEGMEKNAVDHIYGVVSAYTPYILTTVKSETPKEKLYDSNIILIGTAQSNQYIKELSDNGTVNLEGKPEGYYIGVGKSFLNEKKQMMILAGNDAAGALYAAVDLEARYLAPNRFPQSPCSYETAFFSEKMPEFQFDSAPLVADRAIWTWGHVIYDYVGFINNMAKLKLNMLVVWNDFPPINAKDFVDYAHSFGIKVVWGYSWAWGVDVDISKKEEMDKWADKALAIYEKDYMNLGGDGLYFQSFTETNDDTKDGVVIAEMVTKWVNTISSKILDKHPNLPIQFGLHATSVQENLDFIQSVDPRVTIIWEDCGSFPYNYNPKFVEDYEQTRELNSKIADLRGKNEKFGVVLKGLTALDWSIFEHQLGEFVLGKSSERFIKNRTEEKRQVWRYIQAYWLKNAVCAKEIIKEMSDIHNGKLIIQALVEDGMLEDKVWYPVALYSQMLWNYNEDLADIMCYTALSKFVHMA